MSTKQRTPPKKWRIWDDEQKKFTSSYLTLFQAQRYLPMMRKAYKSSNSRRFRIEEVE